MAKNTKPIVGTELTTKGAALNVVNKLYLDTMKLRNPMLTMQVTVLGLLKLLLNVIN